MFLPDSKVSLGLAVAFAIIVTGAIGTHNFGGLDREAFTLQEWMWALQGGYLNTMMVHFVNHGGL